MHHRKSKGKTAIKVKGIIAHVESLLQIRNNYSFVFKSGESYYCVGEHLIPASDFEKAQIIPLLKNQEFQNVSLDPRHF